MSHIHKALNRAAELSKSDSGGVSPETSRGAVNSVIEQHRVVHGPHLGEHEAVIKTVWPGDTGQQATAERADLRAPVSASGVSESPLVVGRGASPLAVERYGALAASLHAMQQRSAWCGPEGAQRGLKTVLVTSARPGEGKTTTAVNLALTLSESLGRRVLLIDAHIRRPAVHQLLNLSNAVGLSDALRDSGRDLGLQQVSSGLFVLPCGSGGVAGDGAVMSESMEKLIVEMAPRFDWVLLDGPSVVLPDSRWLASVARAVLLVIRSGATSYRDVRQAIADLGSGCVLGAVLNSAEIAEGSPESKGGPEEFGLIGDKSRV